MVSMAPTIRAVAAFMGLGERVRHGVKILRTSLVGITSCQILGSNSTNALLKKGFFCGGLTILIVSIVSGRRVICDHAQTSRL